MEFTGERYVPSVDGQIKYEHLHRYALSLSLARGKSVLDIACGEGYGSALLAQVAKSVVGVDIDATTLNYARQSYYDKNLTFLAGSCESIPLPDQSVEVVTSFETIEHHDKHEEMMLEIKRVLKPGGLLIISSPNRFVYSDEPNYVNEYHVKELYYDELMELLSRHFKHVNCHGQRLATGSFVFPLGSASDNHYQAYTGDARQLIEQVCPLPAPVYFLAVCSDASLPKAHLDSVYMDSKDDLLKNLEAERLNHIHQLQLQVQGLTDTLAAERGVHQSQRAELAAQLTTAQTQIAEQEANLERGRAQLAVYEAQLAQRAEEWTSAQTQIARQETDLERGRKQLAIYEEQLAQRTEEWTSAQTQIARQDSDLERGRKQLSIYEEQLAQQSVELSETRAQVARYELEVAHQRAESAKDRARLSDYKAQLAERIAELTKTRGQIAAYQAEVARRAAESSKARARLALLRDPRSSSLNDISPFSKLAAFGAGKSGVIHSALDSPDGVLCASNYIDISGWAFSTEAPITRVEVFLDNQFLAALSYEVERPDVVAAFSEIVPPRCGFKERVMLNGMTGLRVLTVRVFDRNGNKQLYMRELQITKVPEPQISDTITRRPLGIKTSAVPVISVIIPVFNKSNYTFNCLSSISDVMADSDLKIEIIVVDDKSTDDTQQVLAQISGLRVVANEENLGFIDSCNRGAAVANGQYLLFLNNDTLVRPRCFEELLETFQIKGDAGLVGAKLLYPDGSLQEAGGVIWDDASGWNFGRLDDPEKPEYCYLREVDYCSGACIMVPRQLFDQLGGFDTRYRPAYCEDSDLAFQVRQAGSRVYYQPLAQLIHFEGVTSGTDVSSNVKSYQVVNQQKLRQKWVEVLAAHGESGVDPYAAKERQVTKRILVLDACVITPDQDAGSLTAFNHIKIFQSLGYKVTFAPDNLHRDEKYTANLQRIGVECLYWPQTNSIKSHLEAFGSYYDLVFITRAEVAEKHIDDVRAYCRRARIIFDTVDLHFVREQRQAELENNPQLAESALRRKEQELALADKADCTLVVSAFEEEVLLKENPRLNVGVVPIARDMPGRQADFAERTDLLFIGGFQHTPNVDAVLYFVQSIYPSIKLQSPDLKFYIVGSKPPAEILYLASDSSIVVTGYVPDVSPYFNRCRLSVAPLRYGAGLKGKVITSLSFGLPMVASAIACEGIGLQDGINVLIADDPSEFAEKVVRLYTDAELWNKLSSAGFRKVSKEYSEAATRSFFERLFVSFEQPNEATTPALKLVGPKLAGTPPAENEWPMAKVSSRS